MAHLVFIETTALGVQSIAYAKRLGHEVTLLRSPLYDFITPPAERARAEVLADRTLHSADLQEVGLLTGLLGEHGIGVGDVDAVLSTLSLCVLSASRLAERLGAHGTPYEAAAAARDKGRCREILRETGVPSLGFAVVTTPQQALAAAADIGYPVVIKPVSGVGKAVTSIVKDPDGLRAHFASSAEELRTMQPGIAAELDERYIVEELAVGELYSVEVAAGSERFTPLVAVGRKMGRDNPVLELGCTVPSGLPADEEAELGRYAVRVCEALGLTLGIFHVEVMQTVLGFRLVEVNPRISGGSLPDSVRMATDHNVFEILVDLFLGAPAPARPLPWHRAASHTFLAAARDSVVPRDLPADWFEEFRPRLHSGWNRAEPGARLRSMKGNFDTFGMIRVVGDDADRAAREVAAVRRDIEERLGFALTAVAESRGEQAAAAPARGDG
ncbi:acetyl-CoA carboxylase biotin carboxylase subunit family protein [Streptomyces sp. NPDC020379]|uniref:acetyl-CoA carboxylase biotin carboxylase subunit family protein n=1 Tax=Streptomyces sp. NPDC020379 TaxID=3365071 RepID=UPI0037A9069A